MKPNRHPAPLIFHIAAVFLEAKGGVGAYKNIDAANAIAGLYRPEHFVFVRHNSNIRFDGQIFVGTPFRPGPVIDGRVLMSDDG